MIPLIALLFMSQAALTTAPSVDVRGAAARGIESALRAARADERGSPDARVQRLRDAVREAARTLGEGSLVAARLANLAEREATIDALSRAASSIAVDLAFTPVVEAERPRGFPAATPVGEIAVLDYPVCRLARVPMERAPGSSNGAFWKLFQHIGARRIPMTAPVEMTYDAEGRTQRTMAFLYASVEIGQTGAAEDGVEVVDAPAVRVASIGLRGARSAARVREAQSTLEAWLARRADLEIAGPLRVLGWNGPMTPAARTFFEVQIPVRATGAR